MKIHLSVDDVILSFKMLMEQQPQSVFDIGIFSLLKKAHERFGAVFCLYAFENYANEFSINDIGKKYWKELAESKFLRIGFHGTFQACSDERFFDVCNNFYKEIPSNLFAACLRLHKYEASTSRIECLQTYGVQELLCRENESRELRDFPSSYILNCIEEEKLDKDFIVKDDIKFIKTDIRLEFHDKEKIVSRVLKEIEFDKTEIVIFTHEKYLLNNAVSFDDVLECLSKYSVEYVFDFQEIELK